MSDGRMMQEPVRTPDYMELEKRIESLKRRIESLDRSEQLELANRSIYKLSVKLEALVEKVKEADERYNDFFKLVANNSFTSAKELRDIFEDLSKQADLLEDQKNEAASRNSVFVVAIDDLKNRIESLSKTSVGKSDLESLRSEVNEKIAKNEDYIDESASVVSRLNERILNSTCLVHENQENLSILERKQINHREELERSFSDFLNRISKIESVLSGKIPFDLQRLADKIEKATQGTLSFPDLFETAKTDLFKKLESVALDCANASLKSSNTDQQTKILERKVENIFLQLKKFELEK